MKNKEVSFIDYLYIIVKWRKLIIINFLVVCIIAAGVSLVLPKWYKAYTTILPPLEEGSQMGLSSLLSKIPVSGLGLGLDAVSEEASIFLAIINSRTVMESVARKFDLLKQYKKVNMEETIKTLRNHVSVKVNDEGTITLSAEAGTPYFASEKEEDEARELSRDMTNFFIRELDRENKSLKVERAKSNRIFIEERYLQNKEDLRKSEEEFKQFQQKYGIIALPEQTTATISAAAELKAQIISKEVEGAVLERYVGSSHTDFIRVQNELNELRGKYNEFKYGSREKDFIRKGDTDSKDLFLTLEELPDFGLQYARLFREVVLQEKILEFLLPQYEQAKIQEAKDTPTVQVLDEAVTPIKRAKPKRAFFVIFWGFVSLFMSLLVIYTIEYIANLKSTSPNRYGKVTSIYNLVVNDFRKFGRSKYK